SPTGSCGPRGSSLPKPPAPRPTSGAATRSASSPDRRERAAGPSRGSPPSFRPGRAWPRAGYRKRRRRRSPHRLFRWPWLPPLDRDDMRHVGNVQPLETLDRAVVDVDRVAARHEIEERRRRPAPALGNLLADLLDELGALLRRELGEFHPVRLERSPV